MIRHSMASKCVVSQWRDWSECLGNCEFAQRVRNRDVQRPPFPERDDQTGELYLRECPPLYEVEHCMPRDCGDESPFAKIPTAIFKRLPKRPPANAAAASSEEENNNNRNNGNEGPRRAEPKGTVAAATKMASTKKLAKANAQSNSANDGETTRVGDDGDPVFGGLAKTPSQTAATAQQQHQKPQKQQQHQQARSKAAGTGIHGISNGNGGNNRNGSSTADTVRLDCGSPNPYCCRLSRPTCSDGGKPTQLIRWYRKKGEHFCRPYKYPFCEELFERAFITENECLDGCFNENEKAVLPNFRVI